MDAERTTYIMIATEIELVGTYINHDTYHKDWWSEHLKGEAIVLKIKKLNAKPLKEIFSGQSLSNVYKTYLFILRFPQTLEIYYII